MMIRLGKKDMIQLTVIFISIVSFVIFFAPLMLKKKIAQPYTGRILPRIFSLGSHFKQDPQRNKGMSFLLDKSAGDITNIKRDPFAFGLPGSSTQITNTPNLFLKGIIWDAKNPSAVINDRILGVGDIIDGFKVTKIDQDRVVLENEKYKLELKLNQ